MRPGSASRYLAEQFAAAFDMGDPQLVDTGLASVETLASVGLLDDGEASRWRRRFARINRPPPTPPSELQTRARRHLDALADTDRFAHGIALAAYARTGLIEEAELERVRAVETSAWDAEETYPEELRGLALMARFSRDELMNVLAGPAERVGGLSITAIQHFANGVQVYWHYTSRHADGPEGERLRALLDPVEDDEGDERWEEDQAPFSLSDDLGTEYLVHLGGVSWEGHGDFVAYGDCVAVPAVPPAATRLAVVVGDRELWVSLPDS